MKKFLSILLATAAITAFAAIVKTYTPESGVSFSPGVGGKLVQATAYSATQSGGSFALSAVYSAPVYTNAVAISYATNYSYTVAYSNVVTAAIFTNTVPTLPLPVQVYCNVLWHETNTTVTASTNVSWALKEVVSTNVSLLSGTASGKVYSGAPASSTYISPTEELVFTGTAATNGWLRLVLE